MKKNILDDIKEIVRVENDFKIYNDVLLDYCFSDRIVVRFKDYKGNLQTWRRSYTNDKFELETS